jgi:hypothetical protein
VAQVPWNVGPHTPILRAAARPVRDIRADSARPPLRLLSEWRQPLLERDRPVVVRERVIGGDAAWKLQQIDRQGDRGRVKEGWPLSPQGGGQQERRKPRAVLGAERLGAKSYGSGKGVSRGPTPG